MSLKAYVRRTILASATEGAYPAKRRTAASTLSAFRDAAHGTDTGWWSDLIWTADVERLAKRYRKDIAKVAYDLVYDLGYGADAPLALGQLSLFRIMAACAGQPHDDERRMDALTYGLRVAIDHLVHEVAAEMGVEL